jgi:hypothetical protein
VFFANANVFFQRCAGARVDGAIPSNAVLCGNKLSPGEKVCAGSKGKM